MSSKRAPHRKWIRDMNREFAYVVIGGRPKIAWFENKAFKEFLSHEAFKHLIANRRPHGAKLEAVQLWLNDQERRTYHGVTFAPGRSLYANLLNLWKGFGVKPKAGNVKPFLEFLLKVICDNKKNLCDWLLAWLAHLAQNPASKPGTALVLIGEQGTGKSTLVYFLKRLMGEHAIVIPSPELLTRNFNSHVATRVLVAIEETPV